MKIIGIDPGLAATGIGMIRGSGMQIKAYSFSTITTSQDFPFPNRLHQIYNELLSILKSEAPDLMVIEDIFSLKQFPKSGIILGKVSGVILLAGCQNNIPVKEIPVREVKQVLTGSGKAGKAQLEKSVRHLLNRDSPIKPSHASDALALALIGLFRYTKNLSL